MNDYPKRYELKLRSDSSDNTYTSYTNPYDRKEKNKDRISWKSTACIMILFGVVFLKISGGENSEAILGKMDSLINSQFDISETTQVMSRFAKEASSFFVSDASELALALPVKDGKLLQGFEETTHPVFMTSVAPTGVTFAAEPSAYVYSAVDGIVTSVNANTDGTKRIVIKYDKDISIAYDNLSMVYVKEDDLIAKDSIIALLAEETPSKLKFEVWVDNTAVDPMDYIVSSVDTYVQSE
ncbi:MAG: M23 family metallopeptidase [Anaerofustis stercorihominis]|nr:M23 family metallopeptidase [Anaerofustis stercorihominis]